MSENKWFVRQRRGTVGNSASWWARINHGYTCDIRCAKQFTLNELDEVQGDIDKYEVIPVDLVLPLVQHHIDMQDLRAAQNKSEMRPHAWTVSHYGVNP